MRDRGSGKSTLARLVVRIVEPTAGSVEVDGTDVTVLSGADLGRSRRQIVRRGEIDTEPGPRTGCRFAPRCAYVMDVCRRVDPAPFAAEGDTSVRCHLHSEGPVLGGRSVLSLSPSESPAP